MSNNTGFNFTDFWSELTLALQNLAEDVTRREDVLRIYRTFDPIEIDTSDLTPDAVLKTVLATLRISGLC